MLLEGEIHAYQRFPLRVQGGQIKSGSSVFVLSAIVSTCEKTSGQKLKSASVTRAARV